jgi:pimeloyl-ACP methyl ester carboxylesterase
VREGWTEREGVRLHFLEWTPEPDFEGPAREPILFLHGLSSNARFWGRVAARLPGRRMLALDQRAHGLSSRTPGGYDHETLVADAAHLLVEVGTGPALVAGHSWGAAIALELAAARPDLVSGLAFIDGPAASMSEVLSWEQAQQMMQPPLPHFANLAEAIARKRQELEWERSWGDDLVSFVQAGLVSEDGGYVLTLTEEARFEILRELFHYHPELLWPHVQGPVAVLLAESDSPIGRWKRRAEETIRSLRPDAEIRWFRSPHDIPIHLPDEVAVELELLSIRAAFARLSRDLTELGGGWDGPSPAAGWSAHDLLAHVSSTQAVLAATVGSAAQASGLPREPFDADRWNAGQVRRRQERPVADLLEEVSEGTARLEEALHGADLSKRVNIGGFAGLPLVDALWSLLAHQRGHLEELRHSLTPS